METPQTSQRMTAGEFLETYPTETDTELWDGGVVEGEVPGYRHERTLIWLHNRLEPWVRARGGRLWTNADLRVGAHDVRRPDLMAWWSGQPFDPARAFAAVPDLVIEVISPLPRDVRRDREQKLADYCTHKIPWYWIVEPIHRTFEEYHRRRRGQTWLYDRTQLSCFGTVRTLMERGPTLDLDALWASVAE